MWKVKNREGPRWEMSSFLRRVEWGRGKSGAQAVEKEGGAEWGGNQRRAMAGRSRRETG